MRRLHYLTLIAVLLQIALVSTVARADPVGSYTSRIEAKITGQLCQRWQFNNEPQNVFGTDVNLGTDVVETRCTGGPISATTMEITCDSVPSGVLASTYQFPIVTSPPAPGTPLLYAITLPPPPPVVLTGSIISALGTALTYSFEGVNTQQPSGLPDAEADPTFDSSWCPLTANVGVFNGNGYMNAFNPVATTTGSDVPVSSSATYIDPESGTPRTIDVDITFGGVSTSGLTVVSAAASGGGTYSNFDFSLTAGGMSPIYFDVRSTAVVSGPIEVCQHYADSAPEDGFLDGTTVNELFLVLLHGEGDPVVFTNPPPPQTLDTEANIVCATVDHLSPFAMAQDLDIDGDGVQNDVDPCWNYSIAQDIGIKDKVLVKKIGTDTTAGDDGLLIKGEFISTGAFADLDPATNGVRVILSASDDSVLSDIMIPGGAGWSVAGGGTKIRFADPAGLNNGIIKLQLQDRSKIAPNQVKVQVVGKGGDYPVPAVAELMPLRVTVVVGDGIAGECGDTAYGLGSCGFNGPGNSVKCL